MALLLLYRRLERELESINSAIDDALKQLPGPCLEPASHIISAGGKRLRPFLTVVCARMLGNDSQRVYQLGACMEMLHAATLLHDDVLDNAETRRGLPAAHTLYGIPQTILAGDALLALGNSIVASFDDPRLSQCYSEATMLTAAGEIMEMNSLRKPDLSQAEYIDIARGKTACLIARACAMGALAAGAPAGLVAACQEYGENLGIAFQLVDDALDFAPEKQTGKPSGGDLREGKLTAPLRLYRESLSADRKNRFDDSFARAAFTENELNQIASEVAPFAESSLSQANECIERAKAALSALPDCQEHELLFQLADYVRCRKK